ncbi:E3 ubiquitin protein ligase rie1 [Thalictrum thalictroides]|uniref:E3 ubiquitin protein ligase rie1 n=1 Tax=Thalictrum thalictroides TaxID=46969 RepID=A0A7J6WQ40_THATH|nr:E3 ubiquitin protein ligase rie1 [Thalictrum thalictroides]
MAEEQSVVVVSISEPLLRVREENNSSDSTSRTIRSKAAVYLLDRVEGRQSIVDDCFLLATEISWNIMLIIVSVAMLFTTRDEYPTTPIRLWIIVYAIQCLIDVVLSVIGNYVVSNIYGYPARIVKLCKSINTMVSFIWWIFGVYWVAFGGYLLMHYAPRLYWLAVALLTFRVFIVLLICVCVPCICCCMPLIIGLLSAGSEKEVAAESDPSVDVEKLADGYGPLSQDMER